MVWNGRSSEANADVLASPAFFRLNTTSSAVSSPKPPWNFTPWRRWKVQVLPSSVASHFSARSASSLAGSVLPGANLHQAVEHQRGGDAVDGGDGEMRIELADVLRRHAEIQCGLRRGLRLRHGGRGERDSGGQKGCAEQHAKFSL